MSEYHFDADRYPDQIREEIPRYDELQGEVAHATEGVSAGRILELGTGTGETTRLVLVRHPEAHLVGIDLDPHMLAAARRALPADRVELRAQDLAAPLPPGPFELVFSALAVHHLEGAAKADLFRRVAAELRPRGRFVLGDVVVPDHPADAVIPLTPGYDFPDRTETLLAWLREAGLPPRVAWSWKDAAVIAADRTPI